MFTKDELKPGQSIELLKALHILTRDGKLNQDSRRKLKQVYHLYQFIEPLMQKSIQHNPQTVLVDHGAGKSYLGFILNDLFLKNFPESKVVAIESRPNLIAQSKELAHKLHFTNMEFIESSIRDSINHPGLASNVDIVTALHACDVATDDAIDFALAKKAHYIVLVPCCQAEVASVLRQGKQAQLSSNVLTEIFRHPIHTREFGSHLTNVLRCLRLESHGYQVTVTELVGFEHSMKNELIIAEYKNLPTRYPKERLKQVLEKFNLVSMMDRFS